MMARGVKKDRPVQKKMVIDCKNDSHWRAIHTPAVNGVVLRRRPIRAIETFMNNAGPETFEANEFICPQSQLRKNLEKLFPLTSDDEEMRRKFLINDILNMSRIMISQTRSRDFKFTICSDLPTGFQLDAAPMKMFLTYRGLDITFRQPKDKDIRTFNPYGVGLFRGQAYSTSDASPVEWYATRTSDDAFYLTIEPYSKRMRR